MKVVSYFGSQMLMGAGMSKEIGKELTKKGCKSALIVCDKNIIKFGLTKSVEESLKESGIEFSFFDEVLPDPTDVIVEKGGELARSLKVNAIIGIGGGSSLDCAKGINALLGIHLQSINILRV